VLVERALEGQAGLVVEGCELRREGPSYMADTLLALRQKMPDRPIALILGMDAFNGLKSWHNWQQIIELAHIVVTDRPNANVNLNKDVDASLKGFVEARQVFSKEQLNQAPSGLIYIQYVRPLNISATEIREQLNQSRSVQRLVPEQVWLEIKENHLYGFDKE